jgi:hypothetical protein
MARWGWWLVGLMVGVVAPGPAHLDAWGGAAALAQAPAGEAPAADATESAADDPQRRRASAHFERGVQLFRDGAYRAALIEFERAYATVPDFRLLYNQAQMRMLLHDYLGAKRDYERYLVDGAEKVPEERREIVERELAVLRERVGSIVISASRDGVKVYVDDVLIGETPIAATVPLNVGRHSIRAEAADGSTATQTLDLAAGELHEVKLELAAPAVGPVVVSGVSEERKRQRKRRVAFATAAGGGVLAITALGTGLASLGAQNDLEKAIAAVPGNAIQVESARDKSRALSITTDVLGGLAALSVAASVAMWVVLAREPEPDDDKDARATAWQPVLGPTSLGVAGRF